MTQSLLSDLMLYFRQGGYVMPPLVLGTVVLWYAVGVRWSLLRRGNPRSVRILIRRARKGELTEARGIIDGAVLRGLRYDEYPKPERRSFLDDAFAEFGRDLKRHATLITAIVAVAPLLGLLGTVGGMIETFDSLGDMSLFSQSGGIAGGISQALFTTQMGLAVAIPGLLVKGFLDRRQAQMEMELAQIKDMLCADHGSAGMGGQS